MAAHSMVRAMFADYAGPLYEVFRTRDNATMNVTVHAIGGVADVEPQDNFCPPPPPPPSPPPPCTVKRTLCAASTAEPTGVSPPTLCYYCPGGSPQEERRQCAECLPVAACVVTRIYDQSPHGNHLHIIGRPDGSSPQAQGGRLYPPYGHLGLPMTGVNASRDPLTIGGRKVYSAYFEGGTGYRNAATGGVPVGDEPETIYMVASGEHFNNRCCFDCRLSQPPCPLVLRLDSRAVA